MVVPQPSTRLMYPIDTATVGDVMVIPSVTNEFGGPVGQNMTLAVEAAIKQLLQVWPPESVE
jgi:hypothetical protein